MHQTDPRDRLIVALDVPTEEEALGLVRSLRGRARVFKVGLQLYTALGPAVVSRIRDLGGEVFLDLKLHDIPNTVANALTEACRLGVRMVTLHALGGPRMLEKARQVADQAGAGAPRLLGVTVLTSLSGGDLARLGFGDSVENLVLRLARMAAECGLDGVVCSPLELERLGKEDLGPLFFVTPGIRAAAAAADDQSRTLTAAQAIRAGAGYLVVGRPIVRAPDPAAAAAEILREIEAAIV
jgi:orotidine-5'-phosphate decarboxylase